MNAPFIYITLGVVGHIDAGGWLTSNGKKRSRKSHSDCLPNACILLVVKIERYDSGDDASRDEPPRQQTRADND